MLSATKMKEFAVQGPIEIQGLDGKVIGEIDISKARFKRQGIDPLLRSSIDAGVNAISRINHTFDDWLIVGEALSAMQKAVIQLANGATKGVIYNVAFEFISETYPELASIEKGVRSRAIWMAENKDAVSEWHSTLAGNLRQRINHPNTIKRRYEKEHGDASDSDSSDSSDSSGLKPGTLRHELWTLAQENAELGDQLSERDETIESCLWIISIPEVRSLLLEKAENDPEIKKILAKLQNILGIEGKSETETHVNRKVSK